LTNTLVFYNIILLYIPWIRMLGFGGSRILHRVFVNKSSGFIGSRFPVGQFWFPVGYPPELCVYNMSILYIVYLSRSVLADRCVVVVPAAWSRWRGRGPFVRSANVIYHEATRSGEGGAHSSRTHTHIHTVTRNVFFTQRNEKNECARGWRKILFYNTLKIRYS